MDSCRARRSSLGGRVIDAMFFGRSGTEQQERKKKIKHSNGFPYCLLIYTEWREDIFTVILKLLNILLPFNISINTALEKCLEKNFGKNGECRLWSRLKLPNTINHRCEPQFVSLPLEWFFKKNLNLRKNTFWIFER